VPPRLLPVAAADKGDLRRFRRAEPPRGQQVFSRRCGSR
jgi:hypothetical protein